MRIPVSLSSLYNAEQRTQWGEGPLPTAYPWSNAYVTLPDGSRIMPNNDRPGSSVGDPRANIASGTAFAIIAPENPEMFHRISAVGGNYYAGGLGARDIVYLVIAGLLGFAIWRYFFVK